MLNFKSYVGKLLFGAKSSIKSYNEVAEVFDSKIKVCSDFVTIMREDYLNV
jgi:hypothetical protein